MKITVRRPKPRNPLVVAAAKRKAGSHAPSKGGQRKRAAEELSKEVAALKPGRKGRGEG
jgi:hypothetical protein